MAKLRELAQQYGCIVVFTNQVYDKPNASMPYTPLYMQQVSVGGHSVYHIPDIRIFLRKSSGSKRVARLMDSSELPAMEVVYLINEKGIDNVEEEKKEKE
jgi:DNA repair protein RadA